MFQIPTLYTNYQELLLDLDIVGKILSESIVNKDELKTLLFEEYKISHPLPTLEDKRYELSDLVSSDYHITYANEIELAENEQLVDLGMIEEEDDFELEGNVVVPDSIKEHYNYGSVTDELRSKIIEEYLESSIEDLSEENSRGTEEVFDTTESKADIFNEEDYEDDAPDGIESYEEFYIYDDEDSDDTSEDFDDESYNDGSEDYNDEYSDNEEEDSEDDEGSDYDNEEDSDYEDSDYEDEEDSEDEDSDEYGDDYNEEDSEDTSYDEDDSDSYNENTSYDEDEEESIEFEPVVEKVVDVVPTPVEISNRNKVAYEKVVKQPETHVNREEEPRELREFVRKHPRCEVSFALQYFSRKEIEKYLMMGKIIKKGTKLHI